MSEQDRDREREKDKGFTVVDRRLFTDEGELRSDVHEEAERVAAIAAEPPPTQAGAASPDAEAMPQPPSAAEQQQQADAYRKSTQAMDAAIGKELGQDRAQELELTFERLIGSLYMTALMQLGLAHEQDGQPRLDLIGARQTIDTIGLLRDKTKGNLTANEEGFVQNSLYELRMAYLEVTNALARMPPPPGQQPPPGKR